MSRLFSDFMLTATVAPGRCIIDVIMRFQHRLSGDAMSGRLRGIYRELMWAVIIGTLVRLFGIAWGVNFPDGFAVHHPDEYTHVAIAQSIVGAHVAPSGTSYPKGMGALAALPIVLWNGLHGRVSGGRPRLPLIVGSGRLFSVAFGVASIVLVFVLACNAFSSARAGLAAAWLLAFGGLHVTQSHFFLADSAATACTLLASYLIWCELDRRDGWPERLHWAAFATGAAFALKLFVFMVPALVYAVFVRGPRLARLTHAGVFAVAGATVTTLGWMTPLDYYRALTSGINFPFDYDRVRGLMLYAIELPGIFTLPLLVLGCGGGIGLVSRLGSVSAERRLQVLVLLSVPMSALFLAVFKLDHFPRHLVVLIPWVAIAGGWYLSRVLEHVKRRGWHPAVVVVPVFLWMTLFVIDTERLFLFDPRNDALRWLRANVAEGSRVFWTRHAVPAGYQPGRFPGAPQPDVLVVEMYDANNFVSGIGWRDSYPVDSRQVFGAETPEQLEGYQALFRGTSELAEVARFPARYLMPEHRFAWHLLGDRARTYVSDVVIFRRRSVETVPTEGGL